MIYARAKAYLTIVLLAYVVVLGVNIVNNFAYYRETGDWQYSVTFCLIATTLGCVGAITLYESVIKKVTRRPVKPALSLLYTLLFSGIFGCLLIVVALKIASLLFHSPDASSQQYIESGTYSVLFCMIFGLAGWGMESLYQWKKNAEENARSQYEILKGQVNPHFFFNSLNTLSTIIPLDADLAVDFVQQLSKVFRYSLQHENENIVALQSELKIVDSYLFLNKQRFGDKLQVDINISASAKQKGIVVQSLLMLVENAIKHNELSTPNPLQLDIHDEGSMLIVENTNRQKTIPDSSTGIGLDNIVNRYKQVSNVPVSINSNNDKFIVKLPLL